MSDEIKKEGGKVVEAAVGGELTELKELAPDMSVGGPAQGIAAIALSMALKYHDVAIIKDGVMYQQYKMEGRNIVPIHLDMVFETAMAMERHLVMAQDRIAAILMEAITAEPAEDEAATVEPAPESKT